MINTIKPSQIQAYVDNDKHFLCTVNIKVANECMKWNFHRANESEFKEYCIKFEEYYSLKFIDSIREVGIIKCKEASKLNKKDPNIYNFYSLNNELIYSCQRNNENNAWKDFIKNVWYNKGFKEVRIALYMLIYGVYNSIEEQESNEQSDNQLDSVQPAKEQSELQN